MANEAKGKEEDSQVAAQGKDKKANAVVAPQSGTQFPKIFRPGEPWY